MTLLSVLGIAATFAVAAIAGALVRSHIPDLVPYLIVGAAAGPSGLHLITSSALDRLRPVTIVATALLTLVIGERLTTRTFRAARWIPPIAVIGYVVTSVASFFALRLAGASNVLAVVVAALAGGGAPITMASIVRREAPDGAYGRALIALHASCDVFVVLVFAVVFPLAVALDGVDASAGHVAKEVARLGVAGGLIGLAGGLAVRWLLDRRQVIVAAATAAAAIGASWALGCSVPLTALAIGVLIGAARPEHATLLLWPLRRSQPLLFLLFFVLGGAAIRLDALPDFAVVTLVYIATRTVAKLASAAAAGRLTGLHLRDRMTVGLGSLPHAGVSAALAATASAAIPDRGIATVALAGIVVFEIVGALIVREQLHRVDLTAVRSIESSI